MSNYDDVWKQVASGQGGAEPSPYDATWKDVVSSVPAASPAGPTPAQGGPSAAYLEGVREKDRANLVPTRVLGTVLNGLTFGNGDEVIGGVKGAWDTVTGEGPQSFRKNYESNRDYTRGVIDQYRKEHPVSSTVAGVTASVPLILTNPVGKAATSVVEKVAPRVAAYMSPVNQTAGVVQNTIRAGATGAGYGALQGFGDSTADDLLGLTGDVLGGAATGGAVSGALYPLGAGIKAVGSNVAQRVSNSAANSYAQQKVAEAISRDARGAVFQDGLSNPVNQVSARLRKLGPEATIADAAGQNTRSLLDTVGTLPGRTKNNLEIAIHDRQAGRAGRLVQAAGDTLGSGGSDYQLTLDALANARKQAAAPFYGKLNGHMVSVDDDVVNLLGKTMGNHAEAQNLYRLQTGETVNLGNIKKGDTIPFSMLDTLKQTLYDAAETQKRQGSNKMASAINEVRTDLTNKLDKLSPHENGQSVYKMARDAFAGPSQLMDAAELGRKAMKGDVAEVGVAVNGMTNSEQQAFRIGALQALREKTGTQSGQTSLLNMWMEPTTRDRIKAIFGTDYRQFAAEVAKEQRLKGIQNLGRGSQTASRQAGMADLDIAPVVNAAQTVSGVASGSPMAAVQGVGRFFKVQTPEAVRDQMGQILLSKGLKGTENLEQMRDLVRRINQQRAQNAATTGIVSGGLLSTTDGIIGRGLLNGQ